MIKIIKTHTVWFFKFFEYTPMYMFDYKRFRVQNLLALRTGDALKVIEYYWKSSYKIHQYMLPRAFVSGVFTSCYDKLGLSRLGFTHPTFRMRGGRFNRLCHRGDVCKRNRGSIISMIPQKYIKKSNFIWWNKIRQEVHSGSCFSQTFLLDSVRSHIIAEASLIYIWMCPVEGRNFTPQ